MNTQMNPVKMEKIPEFFKPILWSYDFTAIDPIKHSKTIIINTINYGDLRHWRWIIAYYGKEVIRELLSKIVVSELRPQVRNLVSTVFSISSNEFNYAPRGTQR